ncbi:glycosyl transferase family 90, partial [Vibrio sp.]|nr:glycosyl transferase family 90 [Vibrio sp.]
MSKFFYYFPNALTLCIPKVVYRWQATQCLSHLSAEKRSQLSGRIEYYCQHHNAFNLNLSILEQQHHSTVQHFKKTKGWTYFFDLRSVVRQFPIDCEFAYFNGDVQTVPPVPAFVKSRPISQNNHNSVILKLNRVRHYKFLSDAIPYQDKSDTVVWRGTGKQAHRQVMIQQFYQHPRCDIGQVKPLKGDPWEKGYLSVDDQLKHKFIICIEGNDVATNLKWVMSSNSIAVMSKPKFETWFMEGRLEAGVHYIEVKEDYSDLLEKMDYYLNNEEEARKIIDNAHKWVAQFQDEKQEKLLELLVAEKYFRLSGQ